MNDQTAPSVPDSDRWQKLVDAAAWIFLAAVMAFAGLDKLVHYSGFVNAIDDYRILPIPLGKYLAPVLIALELGVAAGLCRRAWRRPAALLSLLLLLTLTTAWGVNQALGARGVCGCWFSINMGNGWVHLTLNLTLILLSLSVWYGERTAGREPAPRLSGGPGLPGGTEQ